MLWVSVASLNVTCCYVVDCFNADVRGLVLKLDDYQIHDVANALKRFFRTLDFPLLTTELYSQWIDAAGLSLVQCMCSLVLGLSPSTCVSLVLLLVCHS